MVQCGKYCIDYINLYLACCACCVSVWCDYYTMKMSHGSLVVIIIGIVARASIVRAACSGPSLLTPEEINEAVNAHNFHRSRAGNGKAANELKLVWSNELASRAQDWANLCESQYALRTDCDEEKRVGQNFAMKGQWQTYPEYSITEFVNSWVSEDYTYGERLVNWQVVWAKTAEVGCGLKKCEIAGRKFVMFGCNYNPAGNYVGKMPYIQGPPCSACSSMIETGGWLCENNLCVPCTPGEDGEECICKEKVCQNVKVVNPDTCECECPEEKVCQNVQVYNPDTCECECPEEKVCQNEGVFNTDTCACECPAGVSYGNLCENKCARECVDEYKGCSTLNKLTPGICTKSGMEAVMRDHCALPCGLCNNLPASCNA